MTLKELVEKLTSKDYYEKYKDRLVEKAVPDGGSGFVGEEITRVFYTSNMLDDNKPLPAHYEKVILL